MERKSIYEVLKKKGQEREDPAQTEDAERVKVLSPGQLVFKRFLRNKLAIFGVCVLAFMFLFAFVAPLFYPYSQTQTFFKYDYVNGDYATASLRTDYTNEILDAPVDGHVQRNMTSNITAMEARGMDSMAVAGENGETYVLEKLGEGIFTLRRNDGGLAATVSREAVIGTFHKLSDTMEYAGEEPGGSFLQAVREAVASGTASFSYEGNDYVWEAVRKMTYSVKRAGESVRYAGNALGAAFEAALLDAMEAGENRFAADGTEYILAGGNTETAVYVLAPGAPVILSSVFVLDTTDPGAPVPEALRRETLLHAYGGGEYTVDGVTYAVKREGDDLHVYAGDTLFALLTNLVVRDSAGSDSFDLPFKEAVQDAVLQMAEDGRSTASFFYPFAEKETTYAGTEPILAAVYEEDGITPRMKDTKITVERKSGSYQMTCFQWKHLMDISASPSALHPFGTDTDGMDILARMMYGGRISLCVGFVVVLLETVLGVLLGGIAGYFGGWVDSLIMRIVDIFYCIPSLPILIILGSFLDSLKLGAYVRLAYMMAILGILGWAGVARLVRGQILSLREQEFMVAAEATGIPIRERIFKHLMPNVMPQLIVTATAGLGSVILTESTLSFLGLGVKHPLATWGTMINSVTASNENLIKYTYIWIPVGALICLTVIAFNFVGDGLRDAFDPKMKR